MSSIMMPSILVSSILMARILMYGTMLYYRLSSHILMSMTGMPCRTGWAIRAAPGRYILSTVGHHRATAPTAAAAYLATTTAAAMNNSPGPFISNSPKTAESIQKR